MSESRNIRNIKLALENPTKYCCSGRCEDTNWGGVDRLHLRWSGCPEFSRSELEGYLG